MQVKLQPSLLHLLLLEMHENHEMNRRFLTQACGNGNACETRFTRTRRVWT